MRHLNRKQMMLEKFGFTLAEVLLVLAIIGVVAAITLPSLMNDINDMQYKSAYKKAFSMASQAWQKMQTDNVITAKSDRYDVAATQSNWNEFKAQFSVVKECNNIYTEGCWVEADKLYTGGVVPMDVDDGFIDKSGMAWAYLSGTEFGEWDGVFVDVNGNKGPNQFGKDRFPIRVASQNETVDVLWKPETGSFLQTRVIPFPDFTSSGMWCPKAPCYYSSWLSGAK